MDSLWKLSGLSGTGWGLGGWDPLPIDFKTSLASRKRAADRPYGQVSLCPHLWLWEGHQQETGSY